MFSSLHYVFMHFFSKTMTFVVEGELSREVHSRFSFYFFLFPSPPPPSPPPLLPPPSLLKSQKWKLKSVGLVAVFRVSFSFLFLLSFLPSVRPSFLHSHACLMTAENFMRDST